MVEFTQDHKVELKATSGITSEVEWFDPDGKFSKLDVSKVDTHDLWAMRNEINSFWARQMKVIDAELDNWTEIECQVCGQQDLAYRGQPFITWGLRGGFILCPRHVRAFDLKGTPEGDIIDKINRERDELKAIFG